MKRFLYFSISLIFATIIILLVPLAKVVQPYLPYANYLLGIDKPISYLILLGNDAEMRANGGFAGSYAKITLSSRVIARSETTRQSRKPIICHLSSVICNLNSDLSFQDIYVPNGQIAGLFVAPPKPIQEAFGHGTWELANADWEPDFPIAAKQLRWFMEKGNEINPDILAILNLTTIKKILNVVGSFPVQEYVATLTPDNLYLFLQGKAELNFFPGSTQKKDALTAVGQALVKKIKSLPLRQKIQIAQILYSDLQNQNIMIHSTDQNFQNFLVDQHLAGVLQPEAMDTYTMIETNLGANKANAYVTRQTTHTITFSTESPLSATKSQGAISLVIPTEAEGSPPSPNVIPAKAGIHPENSASPSTNTIHHQVTIKFQNSSPESNPSPPFHYGGDYITYLRLYVPENAQNISLTRTPEGGPPLDLPPPSPSSSLSSENYDLRSAYGLTEIGFWHTTKAGNESSISLTYDLPLSDSNYCPTENRDLSSDNSPCTYTLAILKQHGLPTSPQTISLFDKSYTTLLENSFNLPILSKSKYDNIGQ